MGKVESKVMRRGKRMGKGEGGGRKGRGKEGKREGTGNVEWIGNKECKRKKKAIGKTGRGGRGEGRE